MKKCIISLAVSMLCLTAVSQKAFTAATFDAMLNEFKKDSKAFFVSRLSEDFRYIDPEGAFVKKKAIASGDAQKIVSTTILEPVIFQSGDLAVVSGIHQTERTETDGSSSTTKVACTYTFQRRAGKWMFVASQQNKIVAK